MTRRAFLQLLGAGVAGLAARSSVGAQEEKRPNIVLFMVDDMGWQDTSQPFLYRHGKLVPTRLNRRYRTPNMERLAREGMLFTQAYASAVCSPTRCSLMSGMNAARHRVTDWTLGGNQQNRLTLSGEGLTPPRWAANGLQPAGTQPRGQCQPPWRSDSSGKYYQPSFGAAEGAVDYEMQLPYTCAKAFPALLRERGYYTIHCGKAHWGAGSSHYNEEASQAPTTPGADPRAFGFDENIAGSEIGGPANYRGDKRYGNGSGYVQFATPGLDENGYYERNVFQTDALADMALRSVERHVTAHPDQPFYLYFALYAIHAPLGDETTWDASRSASQDLALDTLNPNPNDGLAWNKVERNYGTLIKGMDDALGAVLDKLEALGVAENTLVLFMADNGGLSVSGRLAQANAPLRGGKGSCYEGGTREPLIVRWPGHIAAGSIAHEPVIIEDFYPTLLEAAQVPLPEALAETPAGVYDDGALAQVIDGESFLPVLCAQRATVREDGQPRALLWHYPNQWGEGPAGRSYNFYSALRRGAWKLIYQHSDRSFELYDLEHDLSESRNLAAMRPEITQALRDEMGRLLRARRAQMPSVQASGERVPYPDEVPVPTLPAGITLQP